VPFGHNRNGPKIGEGAPPPFWGGEPAPHLTQSRLGRGLSYTKWHLDPCSHLAATGMGRTLGAVPLWRRRAGYPSNTMWPGPRPTCTPSFIFIRPTVWPQYTNVTDRTSRTDRQDRQDREDRQTGQRSDSIERTVLQTVAQKSQRFWPPRWRVKSEPHQTWHSDRGSRARSCTSTTFWGPTDSFAATGC